MKFLTFITMVALLSGGVAVANEASPNTIDMTRPLLDENNKVVPNESTRAEGDKSATCTSCKPLTIGDIVARALINGVPAGPDGRPQETISGEQKLARWSLAQRLHDNAAATLQSNEVSLIKRLIAYMPTIVVARVEPLIAPNDHVADVTP